MIIIRIINAAEGDLILKVAAPVLRALERRRRRVCWGLAVLPLMPGFWTKQVILTDRTSCYFNTCFASTASSSMLLLLILCDHINPLSYGTLHTYEA
eukprot:243612-Heterocapsa_arctica.AAC.1